MDQEKKEQAPKTKKSNKMKWWIIGIAAFVFLAALGQAIEEIIEEQKEKKIVQAEEEAKEEKKEDKPKEEPKEKKPATFEDKVKQAINKSVGNKANNGKKRIIEIDANEGAGTVVLKLNGNENLTLGMTRRGLLMDSGELFEEIFKIKEVERVNLQWILPGEDQYGNDTDLQAMRILLYRETAEKVKWDNPSIPDLLPNFAESYKLHPALK